jgi:hypothetical protein
MLLVSGAGMAGHYLNKTMGPYQILESPPQNSRLKEVLFYLIGLSWLIQDALTFEQLLFLASRFNDSTSRDAKGSGLFVHLKSKYPSSMRNLRKHIQTPRATPHCAFSIELRGRFMHGSISLRAPPAWLEELTVAQSASRSHFYHHFN